jgi:N-acetyl-anhydromuramyl-L-alanine amidase AmpD
MSSNTCIVVCGKKYDIGTRVVLWTEPGGFSAYDKTAYEIQNRKTGKVEVIRGKRYKSRLFLGGTPDLAKLKKVVWQFALHHSGLFRSHDTYDTLQQRGLSVHFILDDDGTLYQTLDVRERAYHIGSNNAMSIGIEIDSRAAAGKYPDAYDEAHQKKHKVGPRKVKLDTIHGMKLKGFDYSDAQYVTLAKLAKELVEIFPLIKSDFARDAQGKIIKTQLAAPKKHQGFICHFQVTTSKIDPISFDFNRFLKDVNGIVDVETDTTVGEIEPSEKEQEDGTDLDTWLERQAALIQLGYDPGVLDGDFGPNTRYALQQFQMDQGLKVDGIWGPKTEAALRAALEG